MGCSYRYKHMQGVRIHKLTAERMAGISGHALNGQPESGGNGMKRAKRRKYAGNVCTQYVYSVSDGADIKTSKPKKPRFETLQEREDFNSKISAGKFADIINANFGPTSLYSTLTLDVDNEIHTAQEMRTVRDRFYRRLAYHFPEAKIVIVYGRGKSTNRFHLHMISEGIPEDEIARLWRMGSVIEVRHLRKHNYYLDKNGNKIDHGQDYTALANYLHSHWRIEFGGHRYKASRNCVRPEPEPATEAVREYSVERPPIAPRGYVLVEARATQYGYLYFKYVIPPERGRT